MTAMTVKYKGFPYELIPEPDELQCNALVRDFDYHDGILCSVKRQCAMDGTLALTGRYEGRTLCRHHQYRLVCDICKTYRVHDTYYIIKSPRSDYSYSGEFLGSGKAFPNTRITTPKLRLHRAFYLPGDPLRRLPTDFSVVSCRYLLCEICVTAVEKSLHRRNHKCGLQQAIEKREVRRAKTTLKEIVKLIRKPNYRREQMAIHKTKRRLSV